MIGLFALVACSGKGEDSAEQGSTLTHPFGGAWNGEVHGHTAWEADWETAPYCSGSLFSSVDNDGVFSGSGGCTILWGPAEGEEFEVDVTGDVAEDGTFTLQANLSFETEERGWEQATIRGTAGETIQGEGNSLYYPSTGGSMEAFVAVDVSK